MKQNVSTNRLHVVNPNIQLEKDILEKQNNSLKINSVLPAMGKLSALPDNLSVSVRGRASPASANGNNAGTSTITTMESGGIKITYEKQPSSAHSKSALDDHTGRVSW